MDFLHLLGRDEKQAFLQQVHPTANRQDRRVFASKYRFTASDLESWSEACPELIELVRGPLLERSRQFGLIDECDAWNHRITAGEFELLARTIGEELGEERSRVALSIVSLLSRELAQLATDSRAEELASAPQRGSAPAEAPCDAGPGPLFATWLDQAREVAPEWSGWDDVSGFVASLAELAHSKRAERGASPGAVADAVMALRVYEESLAYLEHTTWDRWTRIPASADSRRDLIERLVRLREGLARHVELSSLQPVSRTQEAEKRRHIDAVTVEIDGLYEGLESDLLRESAMSQAVSSPGLPESTKVVSTAIEPPGDSDAGGEPSVLEPTLEESGEPSALQTQAAQEALPQEVHHALDEVPQPAPSKSLPTPAPSPDPLAAPTSDAPMQHPILQVAAYASPAAPPDPGPSTIAPATELPAERATFEAFAASFSVTADGRAQPAEWRKPDFASRLTAAFDAELARQPPRFARLWIFAAAGAACGAQLPAPEDVADLAVWTDGEGVRVCDASRVGSIREAYEGATLAPSARWRVAVLLEALSPSTAGTLDAIFAEEVVKHLELGNRDLEQALIELLRLGSRLPAPLAWLRRSLEPEQEISVVAAEHRVRARRGDLYDYFRKVMHAGGGKIQQTHCREAWQAFVDSVLPGLRRMFPSDHGGAADWDPDELEPFASTIEDQHAEIANRMGARLKDRVRMDRIAQRIGAQAAAANAAMRELQAAREQRAGRIGTERIGTDVFRRLVDGPPLAGSGEAFRQVLVRALSPQREPDEPTDPLALTEDDIRRHPALLELLPDVRGTATTLSFGRASDVLDAPAAAAVLLAPAAARDGSHQSLPDLLRSVGLAHLLGKVVTLGHDDERLRVHADEAARLEQIQRRLAELDTLRLRLADAASPLGPALARVRRAALERLDSPPERPHLLLAWLNEVLACGRLELDRCARAIHHEAEQQGTEVGALIRRLVDAGRFAEALTLLRGAPLAPGRAGRHTRTRHEAAAMFREPIARLAQPDIASRVQRWREPSGDDRQERTVRTEFAKLVLDDLYDPKEVTADRISVRCDLVRRRLDERQLNPSYVPQLQRFRCITIPRVPVRPSDPSFPVRAADAAGQHPDDLVVLLAPRITRERRESVLRELRRRSATATLVDDLDMCRLLNPGGDRPDGILGLLEVALEQQRWTAMSPFSIVEGQHVQLEMYVGRRDEARALAHTSSYSRLFSGRKLGKSALLRFVEQRYDGRDLPSGLKLRVLYVSSVGVETDVALVDQIVERLGERCGKDREYGRRPGESPVEHLERAMKWFVETHRGESLLVVLDEADAFVEGELERYQQRPNESCLSWVMSRRIESPRDTQGLPRVRFVFTGYRVTHTKEGVWSNWNDVLRLVPFPAEDAAELLVTPLARLGIDASEQGAIIAHRCGYQPAVLLRFGERLLTRLEERYPPALRANQPVVVTADDAAATFEEEAVQDEIRAVARNNFQGNPAGAALFGVLLSIFLGMGPAAVLDAAEDRILERLGDLDGGDFGWLVPDGGSVHDEIRRSLRDLVERQLLVERCAPGERGTYGLKFPHHLVVLSPLAREEALREEIRRLRTGSSLQRHQGARGLLARQDFAALREIVTRADPGMPIAAVIGQIWAPSCPDLRPVMDRGLFDPLGLDRSRVFDAPQVIRGNTQVLGDALGLAVHGLRAADVDEVLDARPDTSPMPLLVGGVDLLRHAIRADAMVEARRIHLQPLGTGRLGRSHLAWWFERARGFNFTQPNAIDRIAEATGGIPLLVSRLDGNFGKHDPHGGGLEVDADMLARALHELASSLAEAARALISGPDESRLEPREVELLKMIVHAAKAGPQGMTTWEDLGEDLWPELARALPPGSPLADAAPIRAERVAEDHVALAVLQRTGLLPTRHDVAAGLVLDRLGHVRPGDALVRLIDQAP